MSLSVSAVRYHWSSIGGVSKVLMNATKVSTDASRILWLAKECHQKSLKYISIDVTRVAVNVTIIPLKITRTSLDAFGMLRNSERVPTNVAKLSHWMFLKCCWMLQECYWT